VFGKAAVIQFATFATLNRSKNQMHATLRPVLAKPTKRQKAIK
jgi:hypothetical protein